MDLLGLLSAIMRHRLMTILMVLVAVVAAAWTGYKLPSMEQRSLAVGAATSQILVDSDPSTLVAGAGTDTIAALGSRATVYAQYLSSRDAVAKISRATGIPAYLIMARGPFSEGTGIKNYQQQPAESRAKDLVDEGKQYRLVFQAQEGVPIITVYATGPSAVAALKLATASFATLKGYVTDLQREGIAAKAKQTADPEATKDTSSTAPADNPDTVIVVRELGAPEGGTVGGKADIAMMLLAFVGVLGIQFFLFGLGLRVREQRRHEAAIADARVVPPAYLQPDIAEHEDAEETQPSRWSQAGYLRG
jgi:hypothetical protein